MIKKCRVRFACGQHAKEPEAKFAPQTRDFSSPHTPVLRAAPDPSGELGSFLDTSGRVNTSGEYVLVKVCRFVE